MKSMKTIEEVRDYLLEHRIDNGDLDLSGLDFSDFNGNVYLEGMKVNESLMLGGTKVGNTLFMNELEVGVNIFSEKHTVGNILYQTRSKANFINEGRHEVVENYMCSQSKVGGESIMHNSVKLLTKVTMKELNELGYELVGDGWYENN